MAGLVILLYHHFPILSCSKENVSELSRRKGKSFLSAPAFLSLKALAISSLGNGYHRTIPDRQELFLLVEAQPYPPCALGTLLTSLGEVENQQLLNPHLSLLLD